MGPTNALPEIVNRFKKCPGVRLANEKIREDIVYFDHGVGSVNLLIEGELENVEAIKSLRNLALDIQTDIQEAADKSLQTGIQGPEDKSLRVFDKWVVFRDSMRRAFGRSLYDIWGISLLKDEGRGPTRVVGTGALLSIGENSHLEVPIDKLKVLLFDFAGPKRKKKRNDTIDKKGKIYLAQGYDGHIAIVSNKQQETWLMDLWQFIADHYTMVRDLERYLYAWALSLSKEKQTPDPKYVRKVLKAIPRIELSIDILTYESLPHNFAGKGFEKYVYQEIYDEWEKKQAVDSLNDKFKTLSARFHYYSTFLADKAQRKSNRIQKYINVWVFFLTSLTIISVYYNVFKFKYNATSFLYNITKSEELINPALYFIIFVICSLVILYI